MGTHPIFESDFDCLTDYGLEHPPKWLLVKISVLPKEKREARRRSLIHSPRRNGTRSKPHLFSRTETLVKLWLPDQPVPSWLLMVSEDVSTRSTKPIFTVTNPPSSFQTPWHPTSPRLPLQPTHFTKSMSKRSRFSRSQDSTFLSSWKCTVKLARSSQRKTVNK